MTYQAVIPIDAEAALAADLSDLWGHSVYPTPLPDSYASALPCALVTSVGGGNSDMVVYEHAVSIDVYADSWAEADAEARNLAGIVAALATIEPQNGVQWRTSELNSAPYPNPDPNNRRTPRSSFAAIVRARGAIIDL